MKVIFLDRDGVINSNAKHYYIHKWEQFKFNDGVFEALNFLQKKGFKFIIVSNQGGVAKGEYSIADVKLLHEKMNDMFASKGIDILETYFCPHHDKFTKCLCRKPNSLMLEKAIARFNVDIDESWLIGDSQRDTEAAGKVGLKAIKTAKNKNLFSEIKKHKALTDA